MSATTSIPTHTIPIGLIYPPPQIKSIINKTAEFTSTHGPDFTQLIISKNKGNPIFNFLNTCNPYNPYYQHKPSQFLNKSPQSQVELTVSNMIESPQIIRSEVYDRYAVDLPEGVEIDCKQLEIMKVTAQFVARNGDTFLAQLKYKEVRNPVFGFLRETHCLNKCFCGFVEAYSRILEGKDGLRGGIADRSSVIERCLRRVEGEYAKEKGRKKAEEEVERERMEMARIDWHDFVVVETIDFADDEVEGLPMSINLEDVTRTRRLSSIDEDDLEMDGEEVQLLSKDVEVAYEESEPPGRIVKNWKRPEERLGAEKSLIKFLISPITGEPIPMDEIAEHMRISLIDPKYKEQKERMMAKIRRTTSTQDDEIARNIVGLAQTRPDIFGSTQDEIFRAVKAEVEKKRPIQKNTGQQPFMVSQPTLCPVIVRQPPPVSLNFPSVPLSPPIGSRFTTLGRLQSTSYVHMPSSSLNVISAPPLSQEPTPPLPDEPATKRQRVDDAIPVPQDHFLTQNPGPVRIYVSVPNSGEGNSKGHVLEIEVASLCETIGSLKEKIAAEVHLPVNKQKLWSRAGFLKDNVSLAYYNIGPGETLELELRERGGRKK